jgi:hypothetical protein
LLVESDETTETELESTTIECTTSIESEFEITTIEAEALDETTNELELDLVTQMSETAESYSEKYTTESDEITANYATDLEEMSTEIHDETMTEIPGILTILREKIINLTTENSGILRNNTNLAEGELKILGENKTIFGNSSDISRMFSYLNEKTTAIPRISTKTTENTSNKLTENAFDKSTENFSEALENVTKSIGGNSSKSFENNSAIPRISEIKHNRNDTKVKVQKVLIFKRPIFKNSSESTTESMITISRAQNSGILFNLSSVESSFIDVATKAIIFWKTSLMILLIFVLIVSLSYYRRRIIGLKAEIVQKNLGNSYNQSCSIAPSTNAYTPTYFPRRCATNNSKYPNIADSDCDESSARSRSNYYSQTYNSSSLHSYESIDDQINEHIYAEIGLRKGSLDSSSKPSNNFDINSVTNCKFSDYFPSFINLSFHF